MIIDSSIIRIVESTEGVREAALEWETVIYYLAAVVALEFVLRMTTGIIGLMFGRRKSRNLQESQAPAQSEPTGPQHTPEIPNTGTGSPVPGQVAAAVASGPNGLTVIRPRTRLD